MLIITQTALELGFLYAPVALALFLSYRILDIADLTTDGCFVLGAAVSVSLTAAGHPFLAIPAAMLAGACAGLVTAFLQTNLGVPSILAGIVTNTGLYTVNLMAMGWKANQSLLGSDTVFTFLRDAGIGGAWYELLLAVIVTGLAAVLLRLFLGTHLGLSLRATGDNPDMVRASSLNPAFTISVGLCLANAMTGLAGAMVGQYQKTVDINSGTGIVVIGLSAAGGEGQRHAQRQYKSQNAFHFYLLLLKFRICFMSGGTASPETPLPCPSIHPYEGAEQNVGKRTKKFRGVFTPRNFSSSIAFHQRIGNLGDGRFLRAVEIRQVIADVISIPMRPPGVRRYAVEHSTVFRVQRGAAHGFAVRAGEIAVQLGGFISVFVAVQGEIHPGDLAVVNAVGDIFRALRRVDHEAELFF